MSRRRRSREQDSWFEAPAARYLLGVVGAALLGLLLGYFFFAFLVFRGPVRGEIVSVPDLRGQTAAEAERLAERAGLEFELGSSLVNPDVPAGVVLAQSPLPGEEVAPGSVVQITVSAGRYRRPVPHLFGHTARQAEGVLTRAGFEVEVEERESTQPAGRVIETHPAAGTPLELPSRVILVVSSGPPRTEVPSLVGMSEAEARAVLNAYGLSGGDVDYDPFALEPSGQVVGQQPVAGDSIPMGSRVNLIVAGVRPWEPQSPEMF